ncbi:MAG: autotransporter-associated beta strand repeat-containing protein [Luteolibacter sp.]
MKSPSILRPFLVPLFIAAGLQPLAAVSVWKNSGTTDWFTDSNWFGGIPTTSNSETQMVNGTIAISRTDMGQALSNSIWLGGNGPGSAGTASLSITNGASLATVNGYIGVNNGSNATLNVSGTGSSLTASSQLYLGMSNGSGTVAMNISQGASVTVSGYLFVGYNATGNASVNVSGTGSILQANGGINSLGYLGGTGTMTISDGATVKLGSSGNGGLGFGNSNGTGILNIGTGGAAGTLIAYQVSSSSTTTGKINFNHNESAYTFSPFIYGNIAVEQKGSGTTTLTAANTYTGGTIVSAGKLVANNSTGSATGTGTVLAQANTTLAGNGTISGAVTMLGTFAPGNSVGKLNTGSLTIGATGTYAWEMNNASGTAGTTAGGWDLANITGTLTFQPGATLDIISLTTDNVSGQASNFNPLNSYLWTIATTTGGVNGVENVTLDTSAFQNTASGDFSLVVSGNNLQLSYSVAAVPEPSTILAFFGGTLALISRRKRQP